MMASQLRQIGGFAGILGAVMLLGNTLVPAEASADEMHVAVVPTAGIDSTDPAAREAAVSRAESEALTLVLQRLTALRDHGRLPAADGPNVAGYVEDVSIDSEGQSARITLRSEAVRQLLTGLGIAFVDEPAPLLVVVPVFEGPGGPLLWSGPNPWLDAWQVHGGNSGLAPAVVPFGEIGDLQAVNAQEALDGDSSALRALAARYQAAGTLVAVYSPQGGQAEIRLALDAADDWQADSRLSVPADGAISRAAIDAVTTAVGRLWVERQIRPSYSGGLSLAEANVIFAGLGDWIAIRHALEDAPIVDRFDVPAVGGQGARVILHHYADLASLQRDLEGSGVIVELAGYGPSGLPGLTLRLAGGAAPQQVQAGGPAAAPVMAQDVPTQTWPSAPQPGPVTPQQQPLQSLTIQPRIPTLRFDP